MMDILKYIYSESKKTSFDEGLVGSHAKNVDFSSFQMLECNENVVSTIILKYILPLHINLSMCLASSQLVCNSSN